MINNIRNIFPFIIYIGIVLILLSLILYFTTYKYKKRRLKFLSIFIKLKKRNIILLSSLLLNSLIIIFFIFGIRHYSILIEYIIIINSIISIVISLDIHIIISIITYNLISILSLKILSLVYDYLDNIYYDRLTFILGIVFALLISVYEFYVTFRQIEIIIKKSNKSKGVIKNGFKRGK